MINVATVILAILQLVPLINNHDTLAKLEILLRK